MHVIYADKGRNITVLNGSYSEKWQHKNVSQDDVCLTGVSNSCILQLNDQSPVFLFAEDMCAFFVQKFSWTQNMDKICVPLVLSFATSAMRSFREMVFAMKQLSLIFSHGQDVHSDKYREDLSRTLCRSLPFSFNSCKSTTCASSFKIAPAVCSSISFQLLFSMLNNMW